MDLNQLDEEIIDAFIDAGMRAYVAIYTPPVGGETEAGSRRCYLNSAGQTIANDGRVRAPRDVIAVLLADGAAEKGGTLAIGADTFSLREIDETDANDRSLQYWVVRRG